MNENFAGQTEQLVMERTGLRLRPRQSEILRVNLVSRCSALKVRDETEYCQILKDGGHVAEVEWQYLARLLTNKESYFFRDKGQIALLRNQILPELIDRNKPTQTLNIWSAGCSTGEEAYTLAMLVDELRSELKLRNWRIAVFGTDIDRRALDHARKGVYGSWSFRMVEPTTKHRYFYKTHEGWKVTEPVSSSVSFIHSNLVVDKLPDQSIGLFDMDLILCRNVFIYFEPTAVATVLDKFAQTLRDGGYLMTGHVETRGLTVAPFSTRSFPESEIYQKGGLAPNGKLKRFRTLQPPVVTLPRREAIAAKKTEPEIISKSATHDRDASSELQTSLLAQARKFADLGQYFEASECCKRLTSAFPSLAEPYELLATIAQEQGRIEDAKALLKKALYLSPDEAYFYMELGAIYSLEGDAERARKMIGSALELLRNLPPETLVGPTSETTARECIKYLMEISGEGA